MNPTPPSVDTDQVERDWHRRGFTCERKLDPPHSELPDYCHDEDELQLLLEGELEVEFLGKVVAAVVGEEIFIPAGTLHTVRNRSDAPARRLRGRYRPEDLEEDS